MRRLAPALAVVVLALAGCTAEPSVAAAHELVIATGVPDAMAGVGFGGRLGYDAAGCVVLGADEVLLAPEGSTLHDDVMTLDLGAAGTRSYRIGDSTDDLGGMHVGAFSEWVPAGTHCSSTKYLLLG